jgi:hypothetical protein
MPAGYQLHSNDPVKSLEGIRPLTTLERSMIQTFPKTFKFLGTKTDMEQMIGNAVPVNLAKFVGDSINAYLGIDSPINYEELRNDYPENIVKHEVVTSGNDNRFEENRNVLVSLVKNDNVDLFLDGSARIYYTGKKFPSTVALNKLCYFMPYVKQKGIRDLYLIKIARVGSKHEIHPDADENDLRLVFEIEKVGQLFDDYKPIELKIWHTFTDTNLRTILSM